MLTDWFRQRNVTVLNWPSLSPDLNPIENVWGNLKEHLAQTGLRNIASLKQEASEFWDTLTHDYLQALIKSMPQRLQTCIDLGGEVIKYQNQVDTNKQTSG